MTQPDGLGDLRARRERRPQRVAPPPRHPRSTAAPEAATKSAQEAAPAAALVVAPDANDASLGNPTALTAPSGSAATGSTIRANTAQSPDSGREALRLGQFYLDETSDQWLNELRARALVERRDRSMSASAVVRLALRNLREQMTHDQILDSLAKGTPPTEGRRGRPRR